MDKTIKEIADELKIDKQKVYRYIKKNHINEAHHDAGVKYYDEVAQSIIKQGFSKSEVHHEVLQNHINEALFDAVLKQLETIKNEVEVKNNQIAALQNQLDKVHGLLDQEQQLRALSEKRVLELEDKEVKTKRRFKWW